MSAYPAASSTPQALPTPAPHPEKSQIVGKSHNSATSTLPDPQFDAPKLPRRHTKPLTPRQLAAIDLLTAGCSDAKTAATVGVVRETVTRWRLYHPAFQAELDRHREETWGAAGDRLRSNLAKAVTVFRHQLLSGDPDQAFRAARTLLQLAGSSRLVRPPEDRP
jgi:hypothetical protein